MKNKKQCKKQDHALFCWRICGGDPKAPRELIDSVYELFQRWVSMYKRTYAAKKINMHR